MDKDYLFLTRFHVDEIESDSNFDSDFTAYKLHPLANARINLSPREKHSDKKERRTMAAARCNLDNSPNVSFFVVENRKKMKTIVSRYMNSEIRLPENIARRIQR